MAKRLFRIALWETLAQPCARRASERLTLGAPQGVPGYPPTC
jgi:hypothetical protein